MSDRANAPEGWWREFVLADPPKTAKVALVTKAGTPVVSPVWVDLDGEDLLFTTASGSAKGKILRRDPRVAMCFDDQLPPFNFVLVHGTATLGDDLDEVRTWATRIGGRYMGADQADAYGARNGVPGELLVRVTPTKIVAAREIAL